MKKPGEKVYFFDLDKIVEATIKTTVIEKDGIHYWVEGEGIMGSEKIKEEEILKSKEGLKKEVEAFFNNQIRIMREKKEKVLKEVSELKC